MDSVVTGADFFFAGSVDQRHRVVVNLFIVFFLS